MTQVKNNKTSRGKRIAVILLKTTLWIAAVPVFLALAVFISLQFSGVQKFVTGKATSFLSEKIKTKVTLGEINISFPTFLRLSDLYIEDEKADTLFYGHVLKVDLNFYDLLDKKISVNSVELEKITGHLYRNEAGGKFNFSFIPDAFAPADKKEEAEVADTTSSPWSFSLKYISLKDIYFTYHDKSSGTNADLNLGHFETGFDKFDLGKKEISVNAIQLDSTRVFVLVEKPLDTSADTSTSKPFDFDVNLNEVKVEAVQANYKNKINGQDLALNLGELFVDLKKVDLKKEKIELQKVLLHRTSIHYTQNKTVSLADTIAKVVKEETQSSNWTLTLKNLDLENNLLAYDNKNAAPLETGMDFNHLLVKNFGIKAEAISANEKRINLDLKDLHFTEKSGFVLKKFQAQISYDSSHVELDKLDLQINNSRITNHLAVYYPSLKSLKDSINKLKLDARFKKTRIVLKDVLYFSPDLLKKLPLKAENKEMIVDVSGEIKGSLNNLSFSELEIRTKNSTSVKVDGELKNVTNPKNLFASASFAIESTKKDITSLLLDSLIPKSINIPDSFSLKGSYKGYVKNFDADLAVKTSFGNITAKVNMNPKGGNSEQPYDGKVDIAAFDLGKLLNQSKTIGPITLSLAVKGSGFDTSNINTSINLGIVKAVFKDYEYKNFNLDGKLQKKAFTGNATMKDENLTFDFHGGMDLEPAQPKYTFTLNLTGADLKALNFSESDLRVSTVVKSDLTNEPGKNPIGTGAILNTLIIRNNKKYPVDSIVFTSEVKDGLSEIRLRSEIMTADFKGNMDLKELPELLNQHINTYFNMQEGTVKANLRPQKFDFSINISNPTIITENFVPSLEKLTPIAINGSYDSQGKAIKLDVDVPQIKYSGVTVDSLKLSLDSDPQKLNYKLNIADVSNPSLRFQNLYLGGELKNNALSFQFNTAKDDSSKLLAIGGLLKSMNKNFELKLDQELILNAESWNVDRTNYLHFGKEGLFANNISLSNGAQSLSVNSKEKKPASPLEISFKNFDITTLSRLIENHKDLVDGTINGNVILEKQNNASAFRSDLVIKDFVFQAVPIGTIKLKANNLEDPKKYDVDLSIEGNGNDIAMKGFYKASQTNDVNILLDIRHLNLASIEPFTFKELTNMSGSLNGKLNLKGPAALPDISGSLGFKNAAFNPRFTDSYLTIQDSKINFESHKIRFNNFVLRDSLNNTAIVNGDIDIHDLKKIELDLRLKTDDFLVLNTTREDNPLYYGKLIVDSDIKVKGTTNAPTVDAKLKLNKGSSVTYVKPENEVSKNESKGIVEFVNPNNQDISIMARRNDSIAAMTTMKGVDFHASINFDKSVQLKMIVDRTTGDSLYIQGGGLLDFTLDRSGKTSLSGKYDIVDGGYFLSLENVVKRSFKIQKGSSVTWSGDILDAYVDLTAIYAIKTSPLDLVQNELVGLSEIEKNKYRNALNFFVHLKMIGFISTPIISFDIQLAPEDRGALNGAVNTKLAQLREDESQLNKQVFALLTLRRFIGDNPLESSNEGGLSSASRSSASKVLTQQLSSLSDKYVNFVDLDLGVNSFEDYSSGQQQGRTQLQLGVSKQLFNDKVTVRVGGNVDLEGERASQNSANDVAGNISIDYKLTEDGRYKLEASRENQYENPIEGELTKTAAGVVYTRNFNTLKQLFSKPKSELQRKKAKQQKEKLKKEEEEKKKQEEKENEL